MDEDIAEIVDTTPDGRGRRVRRLPGRRPRPHVRVGHGLVIMNGPQIVADAVITETL